VISTVLQHAFPSNTAGGPDEGPAIVIHAPSLPFKFEMFRPDVYVPGARFSVSPGFSAGRTVV
jgi:hypothetical protein